MKKTFNPSIVPAILTLFIILFLINCSNTSENPQNLKFGLVIHGGGGVRDKAVFEENPELEKAYREKLHEALAAGYEKLKNGGSSVDAVEAAINVMEDSPLFNAGKGASFTREGKNELDASIMNGKTLRAGGLGAVQYVKNPISLARLVMEKTPHVLLVDQGALAFAKEMNVELKPADYFYTETKWKSLQRRLKEDVPYGGKLQPKTEKTKKDPVTGSNDNKIDKELFGTVGAVALDKEGNLAAGTSTGGRVKKRPGRVGDSPIIGASTYADNRTCATSTTGLGEIHMTILTGKDISAQLELKGTPVQQAADNTMQKVKLRLGGGGVIAIDKDGNIGISYLGDGMYRGYVGVDGKIFVKIYDK